MKAARRLALLLMIPTMAMPSPQFGSHAGSVGVAANPEWSALQRSTEEMHAAMMSAKSSNDADIDFVNLMLSHHQAAIAMAKTQLLYGTDPQIRRLAQEIVIEQQSEIELMQLWQKNHLPKR